MLLSQPLLTLVITVSQDADPGINIQKKLNQSSQASLSIDRLVLKKE